MGDPLDDEPSGLVDMARGIYKKANDLVSKVPTPFYKPAQPSDHDKAVQDMNKQADDKTVQDANKSFIHPTQTKAQSRPAVAPKVQVQSTKSMPRKR